MNVPTERELCDSGFCCSMAEARRARRSWSPRLANKFEDHLLNDQLFREASEWMPVSELADFFVMSREKVIEWAERLNVSLMQDNDGMPDNFNDKIRKGWK